MTVHITAPPSKSMTHRMLVLGAQAGAETVLRNVLWSLDTQATFTGLQQFGADLQRDGSTITCRPATLSTPEASVDCQNSGTSLRFLTGLAARMDAPVALTGDESLRRRPNAPLLRALSGLGCGVEPGADCAPFTVEGPIASGAVAVDGNVSSQFASSLLLSLPFLEGESTLRLTGEVVSRPYLNLTLDALATMGVRVDASADVFHIPGNQVPEGGDFRIPGDWSSAAFMLAAGAMSGKEVVVGGLDRTSRQADRVIVDLLRRAGCTLEDTSNGVRLIPGALQPLGAVDVSQCPDLFPIMCILATACPGPTTFTGAGALRHKESNRLQVMAEGLAACGIQTSASANELTVHGGDLSGASVAVHGDHRVHMAFQVANLVARSPIQVDGAEHVAVSYPEFHDHLHAIQEAEA